MYLKCLAAAVASLFAGGCMPAFTMHMPSFGESPSELPQVTDLRSEDVKTFRFVDFAKVSYKTRLGDANTTPDRITALQRHLALSGLGADDTIEVTRFDIHNDASGSACKGCALAAVSIPAAIIVEAGRKKGEDVVICDLTAALNGVVFEAQSVAKYRPLEFDGPALEIQGLAVDECLHGLFDDWLRQAGRLAEE